ncbi:hypothetical protein [Mycolicibacterium pallens]|uniref:PE-PGRS family protein n=1 Tax=Mycolicibacterium pallens TaxID=370524 RepID=A0ABX8VIV0_9MYCO|nr:hypothetical protein [Mycolicibacterium pallens]QYL17710.1 hypothetical protein K0O64_03865 [Mycolicibacterium pallens]
MHIAVRSTVATGVAMVGAGAIALAPIHPVGPVALPLSEINVPAAVSTMEVELAALPNPITPWVNVFTTAVTNAGALGSAWLEDPAPVARQLALNWIGYGQTTATALRDAVQGAIDYFGTTFPQALQTAFQQIRDGQLSAAGSTLSDAVLGTILYVGAPLFPLAAIPGQITENLNKAVLAATDINSLFGLVLGAAGPVGGVIRAVGDTAQQFLDAVNEKDYNAAAQAVFDVAPNIVTAIINGYTTTDGTLYPGLLTPPDDQGINAGLGYTLLVSIPRAIATALGATAPAPVTRPAASLKAASADATEASDLTEATDTKAQPSAPKSSVGGSKANAKTGAKTATAAKKPTGAKKSTGAKSARPSKGSGHGGGGSAAE